MSWNCIIHAHIIMYIICNIYNRAQNQYLCWTIVVSIFAVNLIKQCCNLYSIIIWTKHTFVLKQTWNFRATYINVLLRCTHVIPHNRLLLIFRPLFQHVTLGYNWHTFSGNFIVTIIVSKIKRAENGLLSFH